MKKRFLSYILILCMVLALVPAMTLTADAAWDGTTITAFASGAGTEADPYLIENEGHLAYLAQEVNLGDTATTEVAGKYFRQTADLDLNNKEWTPIGRSNAASFTGHYDGQGYKIVGLSVENVAEGGSAGLFGYVGNAIIENVHVSGEVTGGQFTGGLAGYVGHLDTVIRYCSAEVAVSSSVPALSNVGGFVGSNDGKIYGCYATGDVTTTASSQPLAGGFVGINSGNISACAASGDATATSGSGSAHAGGFAGVLFDGDSVKACYATGTAVAEDKDGNKKYSGGFAGTRKDSVTIENCYGVGAASEDLVGNGDVTGITAMTEAEMEDAAFTALLNTHMQTFETQPASWIQTAVDTAPIPVQPFFTSGTGADANNAYIIENEAQLRALANYVNLGNGLATMGKYFKLTADIALEGGAWTPIGDDRSGGESTNFMGVFDGDGHTVSGLSISQKHHGSLGLFGYILKGTGSTGIKNLHVSGTINVTGSDTGINAGLLAGMTYGSLTIESCSSSGTVTVGATGDKRAIAGGLVGVLESGVVLFKGYSGADVSASVVGENIADVSAAAGGLIGSLASGTVSDAFATGNIFARATGKGNAYSGGIWGGCTTPGNVTRVYSTGDVIAEANSGDVYAGALGGFYNTNTVSEAWASGKVSTRGTGTVYAGGLVGRLGDSFGSGGAVANSCYWSEDTKQTVGVGVVEAGATDNTSAATALKREDMLGDDALNNMSGLTPAKWVTKEGDYYPQLAAFATDGTDAQKAASLKSVTYIEPVVIVPTPPTNKITAPTTDAGWQDAAKKALDAKDGETVTIDMTKTTEVTGEFFETIAGKDVDVVFDLGGGMSWTVNGTDIPADTAFSDMDLDVSTGDDLVPVEVRNIDGSVSELQLRLAHEGEFGFKLTLTVTLDTKNAGYIANLFYYNSAKKALEFQSAVTVASDGSVDFVFDHASDYLIVVSEESMEPMPFTDVKEDDWFYDDVKYVFKNGLFEGISDTAFSPNTPMSRAMLVTVLWRMEGAPVVDDYGMYADFADVEQGSYYEKAVGWAVKNELVEGYDGVFFGPDDDVTREQVATVLYRYAGAPELNAGQLEFGDAELVNDLAWDAMVWVTYEGIITGKPGSLLDPQGSATRAEVAAVLHRYLEA